MARIITTAARREKLSWKWCVLQCSECSEYRYLTKTKSVQARACTQQFSIQGARQMKSQICKSTRQIPNSLVSHRSFFYIFYSLFLLFTITFCRRAQSS